MPYPTKYTRQYGFQGYQDANPSRPLPGDKVDADYNAVALSSDEVVEFLKLHTRSDGLLKNGVVSMDSLGADVLSAIALGDASALASAVAFTPSGGLSSTNVQDALEELDAEKQPLDADLTAIAALTTTLYGRSLLTQADAAAAQVTLGVRTVLTGNATYYVRTDGSDSNTGLADSAGGAFLTIAKAITVVQALDRSTYSVTIQVRSGTWTVPVVVPGWGPGTGTVTITGDTTTPSNVTISVTGAAFTFSGGKTSLQGFKVVASTYGLYALSYAELSVTGAMEYGACTLAHMRAETYASIIVSISANYTISGAALRHWDTGSAHATIYCRGMTITITGAPAFSQFARGLFFGTLTVDNITFSGAATGQRYNVTGNAMVYTAAGGATYLPGNSAGAVAEQGQYL